VKINICALSDTHNRHNRLTLKPGDLLIHAGDFSGMGYHWEQERFVEWYRKQPYTCKILIAGNHEKGVEAEELVFRRMCEEAGIIYLNDSSVELQFLGGIVYIDQNIPDIQKIKVHGSPMTPFFYNWAFNRARVPELVSHHGRWIKEHWDLIPEDTDILVTHGPPYKILDQLHYVDGTPKNEYVGCEELYKRIQQVKPDIHIFGHIHTHGGCEKHENGISYYNASICDEQYMPTNKIHYIEYEKELDANKP